MERADKSAAMRKRFRRRAAIEPVISHLKADFRFLRCFLKGFQGDQLNLMLAAAMDAAVHPFLAPFPMLALDPKLLLPSQRIT